MINGLYCSEMSKCQSCKKDEPKDLMNFHNHFLKNNNDSALLTLRTPVTKFIAKEHSISTAKSNRT